MARVVSGQMSDALQSGILRSASAELVPDEGSVEVK